MNEQADERETRRLLAAFWIAASYTVWLALIHGRNVPRAALHPDFRDRLVCWDGILDGGITLDVLVLAEADRLAGEIPPPEPAWPRLRRAA